MNDRQKTKLELLDELTTLRQEVKRLAAIEAEYLVLQEARWPDEARQSNGATSSDGSETEEIDARHIQEALRKSESRNRAMLNALPDLMFVIRGDGTYLDFKGGQSAKLLKPLSEILGNNVSDVLPPDLAAQRMHHIKKALKTGQVQHFEYPIVIDGNLRHEESRIVASGNNEVVNIVRDITEQKKTASRLEERIKELDCLNDIGKKIASSPTIPEFLTWLADRIPAAMQYPGCCSAAIQYDDEIYGAPETLEMPAKIVQAVRVLGNIEGRVHIAYTETLQFLDEESALLGGITGRVSSFIESQRLDEERQAAVTELVQSQEFLRTVIDTIPNPIFFKDTDGIYLGVNKAFLEAVGKREEDVVGKTVDDLGLDPKLVEEEQRTDEALFQQPGEHNYETSMQYADGAQREIVFSKGTFSAPDGETGGLVGTMIDITERMTAEIERERLLYEVQRLATIVENHPDFIGVGTLDGQALYVNPSGLKMMGLPPGYDVSSMAAADFYPEADAKILIEEGVPVALKEGSWTTEANLLRVDGSTIPVEETVGVNYGSGGEPRSFSITMRDITERKATEVEREQLLQEVEAAYRQYVRREWDEFLADQHQSRWQVEHKTTDQPLPDTEDIPRLETAISLRGQQIGQLSLEDIDPNRHWTAEEIALVETVSEQLALTIENLRLFNNTQQRAIREQLTRQIADKMRALPDVESIIRVGVEELAKVLGSSHTVVELSMPRDDTR